jgi:hypothetical protein
MGLLASPNRVGPAGVEIVVYPGHLGDLPWLFARREAFGRKSASCSSQPCDKPVTIDKPAL